MSVLKQVKAARKLVAFDSKMTRLSICPGCSLQKYILDMPKEVLSTAFGQMIAPGLGGVQGRLNSAPPPSSASQKPTPFGSKPVDVTAAVSDSLR